MNNFRYERVTIAKDQLSLLVSSIAFILFLNMPQLNRTRARNGSSGNSALSQEPSINIICR